MLQQTTLTRRQVWQTSRLRRHSNTFGKVKIGVDVSDIIRITGFSAIIRNHPLICAGSLLHNLEGSDP